IDHSWPKKTVCAPKPGHKPRFLATGGQKMRWCPEIGAGAEKLDHSQLLQLPVSIPNYSS
ncbi:MAG: hypothetical protein QM296_10880, partial [Bacillota bacterium]|nr:hypothetical protein [Bacillota bacterium]